MSGFIMGEVGPCQVKFDGVDLGMTNGGVTFSATEEVVKIYYDQTGKNVQNIYGIGGSATVKLALANPTLAQLEPLVPGATIDADGMLVKVSVGLNKRAAMAKELILTIYDGAVPSVDPKATLVIFKATPTYEGNLKFDDSTQRSHAFTFEALPDDLSTNVNGLYRYGIVS